MTRTVSLGPDGSVVSNDVEGLLGRLLGNVVLGGRGPEIPTLFAPDGEGFCTPSIGGAMRLRERDDLPPPYDEDPELDPERVAPTHSTGCSRSSSPATSCARC